MQRETPQTPSLAVIPQGGQLSGFLSDSTGSKAFHLFPCTEPYSSSSEVLISSEVSRTGLTADDMQSHLLALYFLESRPQKLCQYHQRHLLQGMILGI